MALLMKANRAAMPARVSRRSAVRVAATAEPVTERQQSIVEYVKGLPGITAPFDAPYFDPLNLAQTAASIDDVRRWRESEITHGRVAMLAALGFIVGEQLEDFPLFFNADGHITGPAINQFQQVEARGAIFWEPLVFVIGLCEAYRVGLGWATPKGTGFNSLKPDSEYTPGDLGFDPLGLKPSDPAELKIMQTKELNNGRLAMIAIAAFTAEELVSHQEVFEHLILRIEKEAVLELDDVEKDLNLPVTALPKLVVEELK